MTEGAIRAYALLLTTVLITASSQVLAGQYSYMQQCNNFQCPNKYSFVCDAPQEWTTSDPGHRVNYDDGFGKIVVLQQKGKYCKMADRGHVGWMHCTSLQFDPTQPLR